MFCAGGGRKDSAGKVLFRRNDTNTPSTISSVSIAKLAIFSSSAGERPTESASSGKQDASECRLRECGRLQERRKTRPREQCRDSKAERARPREHLLRRVRRRVLGRQVPALGRLPRHAAAATITTATNTVAAATTTTAAAGTPPIVTCQYQPYTAVAGVLRDAS